MGELIAKVGGALLGGMKSGVKSIAAGKTQANLGLQSPHLASAATRVGRFSYGALGSWIVFSWYTAYVNQRVPASESWTTKFILPTGKNAIISPPDRPNKTGSIFGITSSATGPGGPVGQILEGGAELIESGAKAVGIANVGSIPSKGRTLVAISPSQIGVPGTAVAGYLWTAPSGQKQKPPYNAARYQQLLTVASGIAKQYGLKVTSGYRPGSQGAGGTLDLHASGLAFDLVGRMSDMKRAASWAAQKPGMFQEVFIHNEGSGEHLHIGLYPDAYEIFNSRSQMYSRASRRAAPAQAASVVQTI